MIGQATADLERRPRRWLQRLAGHPYLPKRQDWRALWPLLATLPGHGLRVLDAGCGAGWWSLELAARRPGWSVIGLDRDADALRAAERARRRLGLTNVAFVRGDLADFRSARVFDVALSIHSAHYLAERGAGAAPFGCFAGCLVPGGRLFLLGPRRLAEVPFVSWLPRPPWHPVFSREELLRLCARHGFVVERLAGRTGRLGTLAQQLDRAASGAGRRVLMACGLYAVEWTLLALDDSLASGREPRTMKWLLSARAGGRTP